MSKRVLVTGLGVVSALGCDVKTYWEGLLYRESLPGDIPYTKPEYMANRKLYMVPGWPWESFVRSGQGNASQMALAAAAMALEDAGLPGKMDTGRIGIAAGSGMGDSDLLDQEREGGPWVPPLNVCFFRAAAQVAEKLGLRGPNLSVGTACSASGYSIGMAREAILEGWADVMVAGGVEVYSRVAQSCFNRMGALDPHACRPFDAERAGTVFGEGAAFLVLESEEHAQRRGCTDAYAEIKGSGWSCDGHHSTAPEPTGQQAELALRRALADAGLEAADIDCVIPHGTGTDLNDVMESLCLERVFGEAAGQLHICAVKSKVGHTGGAAGAFACLTGALILQQGLVPPTGNVKAIDPRCSLKIHTDGPVQASVRHVVVNAYAFGGNNCSVILGRAEV